MPSFAVFSNTLPKKALANLRNWLPKFLIADSDAVTQPLLSREAVLDLRLRVLSQQAQPNNHFDTAHQRMGDSRSVHRGYGLDYEESRAYQAGDEPRYMNWSLTARTGELFMKVFREERRPGVFILVDRRSTMRFGTRTRLKVTQAARAATCISFSAQQNHTSVGGVILNAPPQAPQWIKETHGEQAALELIQAACAPCPPCPLTVDPQQNPKPSAAKEADFSYVLNMLQAMLIPGTTVFLISDFIDLKEQHRPKLMQLAAENPIHAIHIFDPAEQQLPRVGRVRFQTSEDNQDITIDTNDTSINTAYEDAAQNHFSSRKQLFQALGITYTPLSTVADSIETELLAL
jgi:uncharacterized protein (DUF58 family)